jgi:methionyl-tRNA synthetase
MPLFPRIDPKKALARGEAAHKTTKEDAMVEGKEMTVSFEEFKKIDLRVAVVREAKPVPNADKLLMLTVDADRERTIVAGIAKYFKPEEMVGKRIVIVANLEPAKIRGIISEGMLLAVEGEGIGLSLITTDKTVPPGGRLS